MKYLGIRITFLLTDCLAIGIIVNFLHLLLIFLVRFFTFGVKAFVFDWPTSIASNV